MKRFLRYFLYREVYRLIRKSMRDSGSDSTSNSQPVEPGKVIEEGRHSVGNAQDFPADGGQIESPAQLKAVLQRMDAYDFEHFIGDLWERMGWETEVSTAAADKGVDVTAEKATPYEQTLLIQAKRYGPNTTVGSPEVQQYASLRHQYHGVDKVLLVTTNGYSRQAKELADQLNVKLINGDELVQLVLEHDALDLVVEYLDFVEAVPEEDTSQSAEQSADRPETSSEAGAPSSESNVSAQQPTQMGSPPSTHWHKVVMGATIGWVVVFFSVVAIPEALWGLLFLATWVALPAAMFLDAREIGDVTDWPKYTWAYVLASLLWFVAVVPGLVYLWRRRSVPVKDEMDSASGEQASSIDTSQSSTEEQHTEASDESESNADVDGSASEPRSSGEDSGDRDHARVIGYEEERYTCQVERSPNGEWLVAYGRGTDPDDARVFVYDDTGLRITETIAEPTTASVADSGRTIVIDALDPDEHSAKLLVFEPDGTQPLTHYFNADITDCDVTPDGVYAVVTTYPPDDSVYVFDLESGDRRTKHELRHEKARQVTLRTEGSEWEIQFSTETGADPSYAIDLDGEIVWEETNDQREAKREDVDERDDPQHLIETIKSLREAYDTAETEPERNDVAQSLADAHWALANALEDDDPEAMQDQLDQAKKRYFELLPWYEGKSGAAKVLRKQGTHYLERGEEERAAECFRQIKQLEDEYSVQLLTEEDERHLEALS
ncbi:restriction endonuclease [Natronolimnobius sp. AArcel1]|uniref:restriction endonuclease n=1 Tax=Natronolimnobius sp. AArcel1 TaxID=1679093 RepID=UPI0019CF65FF|nr:restriction endonuclease [Natronolimnobius sp. AArcel1]